jgi:hypothetical protein
MADIGSNGVVTNSTKQGGLLAAYYFGAMWACFVGGTNKSLQNPLFCDDCALDTDDWKQGG